MGVACQATKELAMPNNTQISHTRTRITVTVLPGSSDALRTEAPDTSSPGSFPLSRCALEEHPRESAWAGLAEAGQILAEAEAHKGAPLTREELRAVMDAHQDAYDPDWAFHQRGITDEWIG